jgi:tetratricopeptide (TPR) repeat protein
MLRRILTFVAFVALVAAVSALVYFNPSDTSFRYAPDKTLTLPLGVLMLGAALAGMVVMFLLMLLREGRHAVHEWRVQRGIRSAERTANLRAEARNLSLAGDFARARALFSKVMKMRDPDVADLIDYATTHALEGNAREAKRLLEHGQKDFGNDPLLLFELAKASRTAGDDAAAISALERALAVYPRSTRLLTMLRDALMDGSAWERVAEIQERIVQLKPNDATERNRLWGARYEAALRMPPGERMAALKAITVAQPDFAPAALERARTAANSGDDRRSLRILEKAIRQRPRGVLFDEIEKLCSTGDPGRVAKLYAKSLESFPQLDGLRARAARYLITIGRGQEADDLLRGASPSDDTREVLGAARGLLMEARSQLGGGASVPRLVGAERHLWRCEGCRTPTEVWAARCTRCGAWGLIDDL